MRSHKIYFANRFSDYTPENDGTYVRWIYNIKDMINSRLDSNISVSFTSPDAFYTTVDDNSIEIKMWNLAQIQDSDIVVINFSKESNKHELMYLIGFVSAMNSFGYKHINLIGINNAGNNTLPPWVASCFLHISESISEAANYISDNLLI